LGQGSNLQGVDSNGETHLQVHSDSPCTDGIVSPIQSKFVFTRTRADKVCLSIFDDKTSSEGESGASTSGRPSKMGGVREYSI
jgi:hypothetical protein